MSVVSKMSNVAIAMQSAIAAAKTITAITLAAPGVVTSVAHGFSNGDLLYLQIQGMSVLNNTIYRVCNVATDTFQLEDVSGGTGIDTSAFAAFSSGTAQKLTMGNSITTAATVSMSGGDPDMIDVTIIHNDQKLSIPGAFNPIKGEFGLLWDPTDAGQVALVKASKLKTQLAFKFTFGTGGRVMLFVGYVGASGVPNGSAQDKITTPVAITAFGLPTYYSA